MLGAIIPVTRIKIFREPVRKINITPKFLFGLRFSPITPEIGSIRIYRSLKILKYPMANVVFRTGEVFRLRNDENCSAKVDPGLGVDKTKRAIATNIEYYRNECTNIDVPP